MSAQPQLPSDIVGLARQVDPLSRRGFFMSSAAAAAAGYTLAAGPVNAQAITTDTAGLTVGDAKVKVEGGEMPVYFARPAERAEPAGDPGRDGDLRAARIHQGRHAPPRQARRLRGRARLLFPQGRRPHQDHRNPEADAARQRQAGRRACSPISTRPPPGRKRKAATPTSSASWATAAAGAPCGSTRRTIPTLKAGVAFYGSLVDPEAPEGDLAEEPDAACARDESAGARPLRRSRRRAFRSRRSRR